MTTAVCQPIVDVDPDTHVRELTPWMAPDRASFVDRVIGRAEQAFGPGTDPAVLELYAREAALDLWLTRPGVTVRAARQALDDVLHALRS